MMVVVVKVEDMAVEMMTDVVTIDMHHMIVVALQAMVIQVVEEIMDVMALTLHLRQDHVAIMVEVKVIAVVEVLALTMNVVEEIMTLDVRGLRDIQGKLDENDELMLP
jgi:hypothetical protein